MKIKTRYYAPPIASREFDWSALDEDSYDGRYGNPIGYGKTELAATLDLLEQVLDRLEDAA